MASCPQDINFLVRLAGLFSARLRSFACRHTSSRLRRCAATPEPTGRPLATTLRPAGPRWRLAPFVVPCAPSAVCVPVCDLPPATPLELRPPSPELCGILRRWSAGARSPWPRGHLEHGPPDGAPGRRRLSQVSAPGCRSAACRGCSGSAGSC